MQLREVVEDLTNPVWPPDLDKKLRRFFSTVLRSHGRRFGDAAAINRANSRYVKALNYIDDLVNTLPPVERIF